jgi:hypothetical protein
VLRRPRKGGLPGRTGNAATRVNAVAPRAAARQKLAATHGALPQARQRPAAMLGAVPCLAQELEVFRPVVKTVPIEVVDIQAGDIARRQEVPGHQPVQIDPPAVPRGGDTHPDVGVFRQATRELTQRWAEL